MSNLFTIFSSLSAVALACLVMLSSCGSEQIDTGDESLRVGTDDATVDRSRGDSGTLAGSEEPATSSALGEGVSRRGELGVEDSHEKLGIVIFAGAVSFDWMKSFSMLPIKKLVKNLEAKGYSPVHVIEYDNVLKTPRTQIVASAIASLEKTIGSSSQRFDVIGHSMGHFTALAAVLEGGYSARVRKLIGLAGVARGAEGAPFGCAPLIPIFSKKSAEEKCPGITGMMQGSPTYNLDEYYAKYEQELDRIDLCSIAVENDKFIKNPGEAAFFDDGTNLFINFARHDNLPSHEDTIPTMQDTCGL